MILKINDSLVVEENCKRIKAYLLSKAVRGVQVTDVEIKKLYKISDVDIDTAINKLVTDKIVTKV